MNHTQHKLNPKEQEIQLLLPGGSQNPKSYLVSEGDPTRKAPSHPQPHKQNGRPRFTLNQVKGVKFGKPPYFPPQFPPIFPISVKDTEENELREAPVVEEKAEEEASEVRAAADEAELEASLKASDLSLEQQKLEHAKCAMSPVYFVHRYCYIDDPNMDGVSWHPFKLWPAQIRVLQRIKENDKTVILKARQLGITWLMIAYGLWKMLYQPGSVILMFSKTGDDATELNRRLKGMHERLPAWMRAEVEKDLEQELRFSKLKSRAKSLNTTKHSGRSFTASFVLIDEAAFIPFLSNLLNAAEETADAGGQLAVISTIDKDDPYGGFPKLYKKAVRGKSTYYSMFLPWYARPSRDQAWYEEKELDKEIDDLYQEYPETPEQALRGRIESKRFAIEWINACRREGRPLLRKEVRDLPLIPGMVYWERPVEGKKYKVVSDPAEGDITSDRNPLIVFDMETWTEVAIWQGIVEPSVLARHIVRIGMAYNEAEVVVERNNHGAAVLLALRDIHEYRNIYRNPMDKKNGWQTNKRTKFVAQDHLAEIMSEGLIGIRSQEVISEIADIEAATGAAPPHGYDDLAMCCSIFAGSLVYPSIINRMTRRRKLVASFTV